MTPCETQQPGTQAAGGAGTTESKACLCPGNKQLVGAATLLKGPAQNDISHGEGPTAGPDTQRCDTSGDPGTGVQGLSVLKAPGGSHLVPGTHVEYVLVSSAQVPSTFSAICSPLLRQ